MQPNGKWRLGFGQNDELEIKLVLCASRSNLYEFSSFKVE